MEHTTLAGKCALLTGGARRVGATTARRLHAAGMNIALHYRSSATEAESLRDELNAQRADSVQLLQADLHAIARLPALIDACDRRWGRLDALINNASSFYPTPLGSATEQDWDELIGSNLKAPFFLSQAAAPLLRQSQGCVVSIADIHAERPRDDHSIYTIAKAGLVMLTRSLAWELRPTARANAVAPGAILWADNESDPEQQRDIVSRIPLKRLGRLDDIARTVLFLLENDYINGQIITVDGGRTLNM